MDGVGPCPRSWAMLGGEGSKVLTRLVGPLSPSLYSAGGDEMNSSGLKSGSKARRRRQRRWKKCYTK